MTPATDPKLLKKPALASRLLWLAGCTLLFLGLYGTCLAITVRRDNVPSLYFQWERHIPYVPWMIWPYLSIDLFFLGAFFVVRTRAELTALGRRLTLALLVATACFLLFPLRYAFPIPQTTGWLGDVIAWFRGFDRSCNLAPSLHIAFRAILWVVYVRHTRGAARSMTKVWLVLVGLSTLLVYQHHVFDVVTGHMLGLLCIYLIPEARAGAARCMSRPEIAAAYMTGALAIAVMGVALGGWFYTLLWPATSLALVASAYLSGNSDLFRKRDGRVSTAARAVLLPYLLAQRLAWHVQKRGIPPASLIAPRFTVGRRPSRREADALTATTVIDLTAEFDTISRPGVRTISVPMLDLTLPTLTTLQATVRAIRSATDHGEVYLHCALGFGRSAVVAAAYLIETGQCETVDDAIRHVRNARPGSVFPPRAIVLLRQHALVLRHRTASGDGDRPPRAHVRAALPPASPAARP